MPYYFYDTPRIFSNNFRLCNSYAYKTFLQYFFVIRNILRDIKQLHIKWDRLYTRYVRWLLMSVGNTKTVQFASGVLIICAGKKPTCLRTNTLCTVKCDLVRGYALCQVKTGTKSYIWIIQFLFAMIRAYRPCDRCIAKESKEHMHCSGIHIILNKSLTYRIFHWFK